MIALIIYLNNYIFVLSQKNSIVVFLSLFLLVLAIIILKFKQITNEKPN